MQNASMTPSSQPQANPQPPIRRIALYPGTFDSPTLGHVDLIRRAHLLFDRLIVAVAHNERKRPLFTVEERLDMLRQITADLPNVECVELKGLTVKFAQSIGAQFIIRGFRAVSDFEYELQMALLNREIAPDVETLFLAPATEFIFLSSSLVKEVWRNGGDISTLVPRVVHHAFQHLSKAGMHTRFLDAASIGSASVPRENPND